MLLIGDEVVGMLRELNWAEDILSCDQGQ